MSTENQLEVPTFPPIGEEPVVAAPAAPAEDPIRAELDELRRKNEELQSNHTALMHRMLSQPAQAQAQAPAQAPSLTLDDLPDPVTDLAGFRTKLSEKLGTYTAQVQATTSASVLTEAQRQQTLNNAETHFRTSYPDLADKSALMQSAATLEAAAMRNQGIDPAQVLMSEPKVFMERVATRMRAELGVQAPPANRTGGVSGGSRPATTVAAPAPKPKGFVAQMREAQANSGIM